MPASRASPHAHRVVRAVPRHQVRRTNRRSPKPRAVPASRETRVLLVGTPGSPLGVDGALRRPMLRTLPTFPGDHPEISPARMRCEGEDRREFIDMPVSLSRFVPRPPAIPIAASGTIPVAICSAEPSHLVVQIPCSLLGTVLPIVLSVRRPSGILPTSRGIVLVGDWEVASFPPRAWAVSLASVSRPDDLGETISPTSTGVPVAGVTRDPAIGTCASGECGTGV